MATHYYQNCRCPHCRHDLSTVAITTPACPQCNQPLEPAAVWATRTYPGHIMLPGWLRAFGWPFLMILGGLALAVATWYYDWRDTDTYKISAALIAVGTVYFIAKASGADD